MTDGPRIVVTGAASGIGAAVVRRLARPGHAFVLHTRRNRDGLEAIADLARNEGADAVTVVGDLADPATARVVVNRAIEVHGGVDWLISNAGFADKSPFAEISDEALAFSESAITGAFARLARHAMPSLRESHCGRVVAVSSFVAHRFPFDGPAFPASAAAKAGLEALAKALAAELAKDGVTVNIVAPGYTQKDPGAHAAIDDQGWKAIARTIPLGRLAHPADVAAAIAWFLSEDAGYVTGQTLHVDGGLGLG